MKFFKEAFENAENIALDEVFQVLITTEKYFDESKNIPKQMEASYKSILSKEYSVRLRQLGIHKEMGDLMNDILQKKFDDFHLKYEPITYAE